MLSDITSFLATIWSAFSNLQVPLLGISFATLYTGIFAVAFSMLILKPILGIAQSAAHSHTRITSRHNTNKPKGRDNNAGLN